MQRSAEIIGVGSYLPDRVLTNEDLEAMVDTSDEWITSRTGIKERRLAEEGEATSDLAVRAARAAMIDAGVIPDDIDMLMLGTSSPDMWFPSTACLVQAELGLGCAAYDTMAACTSFVFAMHAATTAIESGRANTVLVVGADALTKHIDFTDRSTCVLFGDGAGAIVMRASDRPGVRGMVLGSDGTGGSHLHLPAGGTRSPITHEAIDAHDQYVKMNGNEVFKFTVRVVPPAIRAALEASEIDASDLAWLIPHQANQRIIKAIGERLDMDEARVFSHIARTGNTSAASIPLALDELYTSGQLAPSDLVAVVGFGAGLTWGAAVIEWTKATPSKEA